MGQSSSSGAVTKLYKNDNGNFVDTNTTLKKLYDGDLSWVDLNKDGNIDIHKAIKIECLKQGSI